jgi:hypothetical protein
MVGNHSSDEATSYLRQPEFLAIMFLFCVYLMVLGKYTRIQTIFPNEEAFIVTWICSDEQISEFRSVSGLLKLGEL